MLRSTLLTPLLRTGFNGGMKNVQQYELAQRRFSACVEASKDLFLLDTGCHLNDTIKCVFKRKGYKVEVATGFSGVPDDVLMRAIGYKALGIFVNKKMTNNQVEILQSNGNKLILCTSGMATETDFPITAKP